MPEIEVRPLETGSESLWVGLVETDGDAEEQLEAFVARFAEKGGRDPRAFLLAFDGETCVGRFEGVFLNDRLYFIREVAAAAGADRDAVADAFGAHLRPSFSRERVEVLTWDRPEAEAIHGLLKRAGFVIDKKKVFVEKDLAGYRATHDDPFAYRPLSEVGEPAFIGIMTEAAAGDPFEDASTRDPEEDFRDLKTYAGAKFDATRWKVAYLDDEPVGVVLPQEFPNDKKEGTLFYVAVRPRFRGRGFGKVLHASGLAFLADQGLLRYFGSTDTRNHPMMRIFAVNGCEQTGRQFFYKALKRNGAGS
jgi:RimJ/RimL family protein N-acetyltransferase